MSFDSNSGRPTFRPARSGTCSGRVELRDHIKVRANSGKKLNHLQTTQAGAGSERSLRRRMRVLRTGWILWILGNLWVSFNITRLAFAVFSRGFSWASVLKVFTELQCIAGGTCIFAGALIIAIGRGPVYFSKRES